MTAPLALGDHTWIRRTRGVVVHDAIDAIDAIDARTLVLRVADASSVGALVRAVSDTLEVDREAASVDVRAVVEELLENGAFEVVVPVTDSSKVRRARRTAARTIGGRSVVVVIDSQAMHTLSEVGTLVFEHADGKSVASLVDLVVDEFEVEREVASQDVHAFVNELVARGALEVVS